jgi:hypothetical protein
MPEAWRNYRAAASAAMAALAAKTAVVADNQIREAFLAVRLSLAASAATPSPSGLFNKIVASATHPTENLIRVYKTVLAAQSYHISNTAQVTSVVGGRGGALIESGDPAL